jgi:hypothetical protein
MSIITRALVAASLIAAATAAQAQDRGRITTYVGGPKSNLTQTVGGANALGRDDSAYAQVAPVRSRTHAPQTGFSGGANAFGADEPNGADGQAAPVRPRASRPAPARSNSGYSGGANAIGVDEAN